MGSWADPYVGRLANEGVPAGESCGLVVVCSWPMPEEVVDRYESFRSELVEAMPTAYVYPSGSLHCTICTLRAFTSGPLDGDARRDAVSRWRDVLAQARNSQDWPRMPFRLRMGIPTLEGSAGIFWYEDLDGAVEKMRSCFREAIASAGGRANEGADKSNGLPLPGSSVGEPAPHVPNIVHSTVLRWPSEPADPAVAKEAFQTVAASWKPFDVVVPCARAVIEDVPYMHIAWDDEHIVWESEAP